MWRPTTSAISESESLDHACDVVRFLALLTRVPQHQSCRHVVGEDVEAMLQLRGQLVKVGSSGRYVLGVLMIAVGASILAGFDRGLEARLVQWSPDWLTDLTTRY